MDAVIELEARSELIGSVADFAYKWALNAGLPHEAALEFTLAVDELVTNIVLFAFPDSPKRFKLRFKRNLSIVEVIANELGEPFDPDRHVYDAQQALEHGDFEGAGLALIHALTDEFVFINKGKEGKEFRLSKQIMDLHITDLDEELEIDTSPAIGTAHTTYQVFSITPDDAEDISRLIYRTYDYTYTKEELYFPKKIERAIQQKEKLGVIVRSAEGDAVGYFAVIRITDSQVAEVAEAVVSPPHRQKGIMTRMMKNLIRISKENGLLGLYGHAVTPHKISQRVNAKYDFKSTALMLAESPAVTYKKLHETYPQPVSILVDFKLLKPIKQVNLYLPDPYQKMITSIFENLGIRCRTLKSHDIEWMHHSDIQIEIDYRDNTALLVIREIGKDFKQILGKITGSLAVKKLNAIYLDIPLDDPAIHHAMDTIQAMGYIFCGVFPLIKHDRYYLRMQKVYVNLDFSIIAIHSELGQEIKSLIKKEYHANRT
ncbi:MAG: GNAT family N-acetyltransferase [Bacteroidota bacterium]